MRTVGRPCSKNAWSKVAPKIYHFIGGVSKRQSKGRLPPSSEQLIPNNLTTVCCVVLLGKTESVLIFVSHKNLDSMCVYGLS